MNFHCQKCNSSLQNVAMHYSLILYTFDLGFKDIYFVIYGFISEFTDKGQFISHKIKGASSGELPVYNTISFAEIKINILS